MKNKRGGLIQEHFGAIIIMVLVIIACVTLYIILNKQGEGIFTTLKELFHIG